MLWSSIRGHGCVCCAHVSTTEKSRRAQTFRNYMAWSISWSLRTMSELLEQSGGWCNTWWWGYMSCTFTSRKAKKLRAQTYRDNISVSFPDLCAWLQHFSLAQRERVLRYMLGRLHELHINQQDREDKKSTNFLAAEHRDRRVSVQKEKDYTGWVFRSSWPSEFIMQYH